LPHNPLIAGAFFRSGQIEAWGRGIQKITEACKFWGKPDPIYRIKANEVMIGFYTDAGIGENIGESIGININATQLKIIESMRENPAISAKQISEDIGIALRNVEVNIRILRKAELVEHVGPAKGGHWIVKLP
jgi:ATP-dependent DNA helicase RecG